MREFDTGFGVGPFPVMDVDAEGEVTYAKSPVFATVILPPRPVKDRAMKCPEVADKTALCRSQVVEVLFSVVLLLMKHW